MDPVSVGLHTLQLAVQSGVALHQFVRQSRNVNITVRELAHEVTSLKNACEVVHGQLRKLAKEYKLDAEGDEGQAAISSSVREELESCKKTLNTLRNSLVDVRGDAPNFVTKGWQQFKLNMKQQEIVAMKSRIHAHTSALQVCLLVMDLNVSYLAPQKVGNELKAKLDGLGLEMQRLQRLLREHCEMVDSVIQTGSPVMLSAANMANDSPESASVWSAVSERPDGSQQGAARQTDDGTQNLLACAQETLSRATSLYEESLYEPSLASRALSRATASSRTSKRVLDSRPSEAEVISIGEPWSPGAEPKFKVPLNLPPTLHQSFVKLQKHLQVPTQAGVAHRPAIIAETDSLADVSKTGRVCEAAGTSTIALRHGAPDRDEGRARPPQADNREMSPSSLSYLKHIEEELRSFDSESFEESRKGILPYLTSPGPAPLRKNRVALTGKLGIGKTYIAAAVARLTMQESPKTPVLWICAAELEQDCRNIADRLSLKPPPGGTTPWEWLCKILRRLPSDIVGPWLVVIDGVGASIREHEIEKLAKIEIESDGQVLLTTQVRGHAESFAKEGLVLDVSELDPVHAANMLGQDSEFPVSGTFDAVAFYLNFEPSAILSVRSFLQQTRMSIDTFAEQMRILTDEASWHEQGVATATAMILGSKAVPTATTPGQPLGTYNLLPVVRCCLHPHWPIVFDELQRQSPAASELLGALSAMGRSVLISEFLHADDARRSASTILVDQCLLSQASSSFEADRMMLLAHRVWLLNRKELSAAYARALRMVACDYPEAFGDPEWARCKAFEPLAVAVTSATAQSWSDGSYTTRWLRSMLLQKRSKFFRDSGTNKWEANALETEEAAELRAIHGVNDM